MRTRSNSSEENNKKESSTAMKSNKQSSKDEEKSQWIMIGPGEPCQCSKRISKSLKFISRLAFTVLVVMV